MPGNKSKVGIERARKLEAFDVLRLKIIAYLEFIYLRTIIGEYSDKLKKNITIISFTR